MVPCDRDPEDGARRARGPHRPERPRLRPRSTRWSSSRRKWSAGTFICRCSSAARRRAAQHTAVKVAPEYGKTTVHVLDASRVVDVVSSLLSDERRPAFEEQNRALQSRLRDQHSARRERPLLSYDAALANRLKIDWAAALHRDAGILGRRVTDRRAARGPGSLHRLDVFLRGVGVERPLPGDSRSPAMRQRGPRAVRQRRECCSIASWPRSG